MKMIMKTVLFSLLLLVFVTSCNEDEIFVDPVILENTENTEDSQTNVNASVPCDFSLSDAKANDTVIINCMMDLDGQTINLPENVTLVYQGGDIINGTINFATGSVLDGKFLNASLIIAGTNPRVKDPLFNFDPKRWEIVEGKVTDVVARENRDILENTFLETKKLGVTTFEIDKLDAYFKVDGPLGEGVPSLHAINVPSDFTLKMTDSTHLRMQPNGHFRANLLAIYNEKNITIIGGHLHGDRDEHDYNSNYVDSDGAVGRTHEWVNTMSIKGGKNITIDGVTFQDAAGDGLHISGIYHYFDSRHVRSKNIKLINNTFERARRTNLVLVNGEQITIENNEFIDGGADTAKSKGTAPSNEFNIEPVRTRDQNGGLIEYERVSHVFMRNNKQTLTGTTGGGFSLSHGNGPIIFENNTIQSGVSFTTTDGVIIRNNTVGGSIGAGKANNFDRTDFVFGNEVYGNKVAKGIYVAGNGVTVKNNEVEGGVGIYLGAGATNKNHGVSNSVISNNIVRGTSRGISTINTIKNTTIENNTIEMLAGSTFAFNLYNAWSGAGDANFVVNNNTVTGTRGNQSGAHTSLIGSSSIKVTNNKLGSVIVTSGDNVTFTGNVIDAEINKDGLLFNSDCPNSKFTDNTIILYTSKTPLKIKAVDVKSGVNLSSSVLISNNITQEK